MVLHQSAKARKTELLVLLRSVQCFVVPLDEHGNRLACAFGFLGHEVWVKVIGEDSGNVSCGESGQNIHGIFLRQTTLLKNVEHDGFTPVNIHQILRSHPNRLLSDETISGASKKAFLDSVGFLGQRILLESNGTDKGTFSQLVCVFRRNIVLLELCGVSGSEVRIIQFVTVSDGITNSIRQVHDGFWSLQNLTFAERLEKIRSHLLSLLLWRLLIDSVRHGNQPLHDLRINRE